MQNLYLLVVMAKERGDYMTKIDFSIEVFPPKDSVGVEEIYKSLRQFAQLKPDFISVTYGAGGSNQRLTAEISSFIAQELAIPSVAHLTCVGATKENINSVLQQLKLYGVKRILALRGDLPEGHKLGDFKYATDLIEHINSFGGFDVYAACYPEGHSQSPSYDFDIEVAKMKADLGVKMFVSQLFYDNDDFYRMRDEYAKKGIFVPVSVGIMPLTNAKNILRTVSLSGCKLPAQVTKMIAKFGDNQEAFYQAGINYAINQITDLISHGVDGIHLYSMNKPKTAEDIYKNIKVFLQGEDNEN